MVEFGLKLQDNQVAEWSRHYIDYEALKKILKQVKQAIQRYEEQAKKKPELAKEIKSNFDKGINTFITRTPPMSSASLTNLTKVASTESLIGNKKLQQPEGEADEKTKLLSDVAKRVSGRSSPLGASSEGSAGVQSVLRSAVSSVSGYFEKRYETTLRDTLTEIAARENEFDNRLLQEVRRRGR